MIAMGSCTSAAASDDDKPVHPKKSDRYEPNETLGSCHCFRRRGIVFSEKENNVDNNDFCTGDA